MRIGYAFAFGYLDGVIDGYGFVAVGLGSTLGEGSGVAVGDFEAVGVECVEPLPGAEGFVAVEELFVEHCVASAVVDVGRVGFAVVAQECHGACEECRVGLGEAEEVGGEFDSDFAVGGV